MILNEVNFLSETLGMRSTIYVLLPQRSLADGKIMHKITRCTFCTDIPMITAPGCAGLRSRNMLKG
jgi:hypothetical protein